MKYLKYLFMLIMLFSIDVYADNYSVDFNKKGKLNITLTDKEENKAIEGAELTLYKIANVSEKDYHLFYEYVDKITCNASLDNLESSTLTNEINSCFNDDIIVTKKITNKDGIVLFDNLELGLYLVKQTNRVSGFSKIDPFLVMIPSEIDNKWIYDIESEPKTDIIRTIDLSVKKVWNTTKTNNNDSISLPKSIDIQLLLNDEIIDTVTLSEENNWQYTFSNIEKNDNYVVREVNVPNGYTVTYQKDGNLFIVTNTSSLVHTGQMYWLVGLFLSIGIIFIITSLLYDRNKNEQKG